jgi:hypothetical protein
MKKFLIFIMIIILGIVCKFAIIQAEERFVDNDDGTVTDMQTGLMWAKRCSPGDLSWQDAEAYCKMPAIAGYKYTDWRMPTIEELKTLYIKDAEGYETDCGLKIRVDPIFELTCTWLWSSDFPETPQFSKREKARKIRSVMAYVFDLGRGYKYADRMVHKKNLRALPVRGTMKKTE